MKLINKDRLPNIEVKATDGQEYLLLPYKHLRDVPTVEAILIPEGATNGDMIKAMFPNCEQKEHMNNGYFEMYFDNDFGNASYMRINKDWWNAPYKGARE